MKKIKFLNLALATSLLFTSMPVSANTQYSDSTHEVTNVDTPIAEDSNSNCDVYAELGSEFKVTIPKKIVLDGALKKGTYQVTVEGDIAGLEIVNVIPDSAVTLSSKDKADVIGTIAQDKTEWTYNEILSDNKILGNGEIDANKITAGSWNGTFNFNISLTETNQSNITVESKNEAGENLNATATNITGTKKEQLLDKLEESGLANKEEIDAIIEVKSNEFDGMADTTFDVSSIAKEGDQIIILHFDETKQEWEFISQETVDINGKIKANFNSYSPVAFVKVNENGSYDKIETVAGLYDINNNLLCAWEDTGIDIEKNRASNTYNTNSDTGYFVITNYYPTTTKVILPNGISQIGGCQFKNCTTLIDIKIPDSVTTIGACAFEDCNNIINLEIPKNTTKLETGAFRNCTNITNIKVFGDAIYFGDSSFKECTSVKYMMFPVNATYGYQAFYNCSPSEIYMTKGNGIMTDCSGSDVYYNYPFRRNSNLTKVTIEDGVTYIGNNAFYICKNLPSIEIPDSVTSIGRAPFYKCSSLTSIYIPSSVTTMKGASKSYAPFYGCNSTLKIYCGAEEAQADWGKNWNYYNDNKTLEITYNVTREQYESMYK